MLAKLIEPILEAIVRLTGQTREALALELEAITTDLRNGGIVPDEALKRAERDHADLKRMRDTLPGRPS